MEQEIITRQTIELISQQTITTQLVILLVIVIAVGGSIAFFTLRGGIRVFQQLSKSIENSNEIEKERMETQKRLNELIRDIEYNTQRRFEKAEDIFENINQNINGLSERVAELHDLVRDNPNDEKIYRLLIRINNRLTETKETTDEIEKVKND